MGLTITITDMHIQAIIIIISIYSNSYLKWLQFIISHLGEEMSFVTSFSLNYGLFVHRLIML